mmetsp:Transcript_52210/g.117270  ORF Transcript_52210/g.117270 Transcript_52210/m.117270 type:complete len:355 (+) Transcript_52210:1936-3000(+)
MGGGRRQNPRQGWHQRQPLPPLHRPEHAGVAGGRRRPRHRGRHARLAPRQRLLCEHGALWIGRRTAAEGQPRLALVRVQVLRHVRWREVVHDRQRPHRGREEVVRRQPGRPARRRRRPPQPRRVRRKGRDDALAADERRRVPRPRGREGRRARARLHGRVYGQGADVDGHPRPGADHEAPPRGRHLARRRQHRRQGRVLPEDVGANRPGRAARRGRMRIEVDRRDQGGIQARGPEGAVPAVRRRAGRARAHRGNGLACNHEAHQRTPRLQQEGGEGGAGAGPGGRYGDGGREAGGQELHHALRARSKGCAPLLCRCQAAAAGLREQRCITLRHALRCAIICCAIKLRELRCITR